MTQLQETLANFEAWIREHHPFVASQLNPGLSDDEISEQLKGFPYQLSREFYDLYNWHNGTANFQEIYPLYHFGTLDYLAGLYDINFDVSQSLDKEENDPEIWRREWFPLLDDWGESGAFILVGSDKQEEISPVYYTSIYSSYTPDWKYLEYNSLHNLMEFIFECFREGAYKFVNSHNSIEKDRAKEHLISLKSKPDQQEDINQILQGNDQCLSVDQIILSYSNLIRINHPRVKEILLAGLNDPQKIEDLNLRNSLFRSIASLGDPEAIAQLIDFLCKNFFDANHFRDIANQLGRSPAIDNRCTASLIKFLLHPDHRERAAMLLSHIKDPSSIEALLEALDLEINQHEDKVVQSPRLTLIFEKKVSNDTIFNILSALAAFKDPRSRPLLIQVSQDSRLKAYIQEEARKLLDQLDQV